MKIDKILAKANRDLSELIKDQSQGNKILINKIIETVKRVCGHKSANELISKYELNKTSDVEVSNLN